MQIHRGIAQLVEQRSPKPRAEGSSPSAPAKTKRHLRVSFLLWQDIIFTEARACRASSPSAAGGRCSEARMAQRSKFVGAPSRNKFWAPQEGLRSNFKSFCPCQKEKAPIQSVLFLFQYSCNIDIKSTPLQYNKYHKGV